jgi:hypothetical protein
MFGDSDPNDLSSKMSQYDEGIEPLETNRRRGQKIDRYDAVSVIAKECPPSLRGAP